MAEWIKCYKGFSQDLKCRGFQFEEGKEYSLPDGEEAKLCENGFHACEAPIGCFDYYDPAHSVYHEVELEATDEKSGDSKRVGKRIKIGGKTEIANMIKAQFDYVKEHCTNENNAEPGKPASAGYRGAASAGESGAASAGYRGAASAGESGAASAGESGAACSRGSVSVKENGIACVRGNGVKARGGIGSILAIAEENKNNYEIKEWKAVIVDGETVKADTWYMLKDWELVEADE